MDDEESVRLVYTEGGQPAALTLPPDAFNIDMPFTDPPPGEEEGCGCATVHRPTPRWSSWGLVALLLASVVGAVRRRV